MRLWHLAWSRWKPILPWPLMEAEYAFTGTEMRFRRRKPSQLERSAMVVTSVRHLRQGRAGFPSLPNGSRAKRVPATRRRPAADAEKVEWCAADADFFPRRHRS